jgi:hypothetical protein
MMRPSASENPPGVLCRVPEIVHPLTARFFRLLPSELGEEREIRAVAAPGRGE